MWRGFWWIFRVRKKLYIVYSVIRFAVDVGVQKMESHQSVEEIRWQVIKAMLDNFPELRGKVKNYVATAKN